MDKKKLSKLTNKENVVFSTCSTTIGLVSHLRVSLRYQSCCSCWRRWLYLEGLRNPKKKMVLQRQYFKSYNKNIYPFNCHGRIYLKIMVRPREKTTMHPCVTLCLLRNKFIFVTLIKGS